MKRIGLFTLLFLISGVFAQSGGVYQISQSVISNGGGNASGGIFSVDATVGQTVAGRSAQTPFALDSGFWTPVFVPTAAGASISGRVRTADGSGITNAVVEIYGGSLLTPRRVQTATFGVFRFDGLETGRTYIITVTSRRFSFVNNSHVISLTDNISGQDFIAEPQ